MTLPSVQADGSSIIGAMHRECFLRTVTGSIGHQLHKCSCHSGTAKPIDDPPELTVREAAKLAVEYFKYRGSHNAKQT